MKEVVVAMVTYMRSLAAGFVFSSGFEQVLNFDQQKSNKRKKTEKANWSKQMASISAAERRRSIVQIFVH